MKHKLYMALTIILPLFVGSGAAIAVIVHFLGERQDIVQDPIFMVLLAAAGMGSGIANLWRLIEKAES